MTAFPPLLLRFGSLHGKLVSGRQEYTDALKLVFGVGLHPLSPDQPADRHFDLHIDAAPPPGGAVPLQDTNALVLGGTPMRPTIATDALHAELVLDRHPYGIRLRVLRQDVPFPALCVHFGVVVHKMLFHLDRVMLHAAAVQVDGAVSLFVGDKGAGKSTTCLALARAGGTVLGEDQVVLWKSSAGYRVSGGDERSRVTARTEQHFFAAPLAVPATDFAGTMKKEIRMRDYFRSEPFRDFPAHRLIFPRVTGRFALQRLKARPALLRMMAYTGHFHRFAGRQDQREFLDFLAGFIATVSCFELSLSDDLTELGALSEQLRNA